MAGEVELDGEIRFFQANLPSLPPGDYKVAVTQTLAMGETAVYNEDLKFSVAGPRFSLKPSDVYSVYPPRGETGNYDNALPHIVLTRKTLPWERTIDDKPQDPRAPCPFAAVLVVSDGDDGRTAAERQRDEQAGKPAFGAVQSMKVGDLLAPGTGIRGPLGITLNDKYESVDDLCNVVDLPASLFQAIVPAREDLPYLAHVRKVDTQDKETLSRLGDGCYAVIVANRFPETTVKAAVTIVDADGTAKETVAEGEGQRNTAYLVSLEGFADSLYLGAMKIAEPTVRLAVLASWSFVCQGQNDFKVLMERLDPLQGDRHGAGGRLSVPPPDAAPGTPMQVVASAFEHGYVGLDHTVRIGERTVSWYRGPLVPLLLRKQDGYEFLPCADAALGYDYESGMFETTYAAAWQLGRLLALQDRAFARQIYLYRREVTRAISQQIKAEETAARFGVTDGATDRAKLERHTIGQLASAGGQQAIRSLTTSVASGGSGD